MSKCYLTLVLLFLALHTRAQDSTYIEYWDTLHIKTKKYFILKNNRMMLQKDSLFYTDGTLWEERVYDPATKTCILTRYDTHGKPELVIPLNANGYLNGLYTKKYLHGQKSEEGMYVDGRHDGLWKYWYPNGKPEKEIVFKEGVSFTETEWWENGNKRQEKDSSGTFISYHENGQRRSLLSEKSYMYWDEKGIKREESIYIGSEKILRNAWDKNGKQTVTKGKGYVDILDGELGLPMRLFYKKGKRVK